VTEGRKGSGKEGKQDEKHRFTKEQLSRDTGICISPSRAGKHCCWESRKDWVLRSIEGGEQDTEYSVYASIKDDMSNRKIWVAKKRAPEEGKDCGKR